MAMVQMVEVGGVAVMVVVWSHWSPWNKADIRAAEMTIGIPEGDATAPDFVFDKGHRFVQRQGVELATEFFFEFGDWDSERKSDNIRPRPRRRRDVNVTYLAAMYSST